MGISAKGCGIENPLKDTVWEKGYLQHYCNKKSIFTEYENGLIDELSGRPYLDGGLQNHSLHFGGG